MFFVNKTCLIRENNAVSSEKIREKFLKYEKNSVFPQTLSMMQEAAGLAAGAKARQLWLTHFSPATPEPELYAPELQSLFPDTVIAKDGQRTTLYFPD